MQDNGKAGGGAGNPGGLRADKHGQNGSAGTGGTIIVFGNTVAGNGKFISLGSSGGSGSSGYWNNTAGGGSSGSGSISIFGNNFENTLNTSNFNVSAIAAVSKDWEYGDNTSYVGGSGGIGTYNVGKITEGVYDSLLTNE